jgi:membrane dipeptidase
MDTTRRSFLQSALGTAATLAMPAANGDLAEEPRAVAPPAAPAVRSLYERAVSIDTLSPDGHGFDAEAALDAGLSAAVVDMTLFPRTFPGAVNALANWADAFREPDSKLLKVLRQSDFAEAKRRRRFGVALACQDAAILDASTASVNDLNLRNLRFFHDLGLRVLQLTHNERNGLGDSFREKSNAGLSRLGEKVVAEMNRIGMLIDLSHCGDRTTLEAIELSKRPCAVTHAGCRALYATGRNKPDEVIRSLAERGGYFGVFNMSLWLTDRDTTSIADVADHIDHVVKVGGIDLAGFGSDGPVLSDETPMEQIGRAHV